MKILKKIFICVVCMSFIPLFPSVGISWYRNGYHGGYHGGYYGGYHGHYYGDAWLWGLGGLVAGATLATMVMQPPYAQPVVYAAPPPPPVYTYKPQIPPGMCRWERYVLDGYGRTLVDNKGQPIKEYTIGSCQYPPH